MFIDTHSSFVGLFIEKTLVFVFEEKNRMFLKVYALVSTEPSLTHILNDTIVYFTYITHLRYSLIATLMKTYIYAHISLVSYKNLPFMKGK
jgi:hypothetical protein